LNTFYDVKERWRPRRLARRRPAADLASAKHSLVTAGHWHTLARESALDNPAPRSARGLAAATNFIRAHFPRAERGAGLSNAPPRATAFVRRSISRFTAD
jgi:hypothetical protein